MKTLAPACLAAALGCCAITFAQDNVPGVPVSVTITAEAKHGKTVPALMQDQLHVREAGTDRPITSLTRFAPDGPAQVLLLIDDSAQTNFDIQIGGIKKWINSLPQKVEIGIAYMRNGTVDVAHPISPDHAAAANAIRLALGPGGADVSPYDSLSEAIKTWPSEDNTRKIAVMITSGIEGLGGGFAPENPYVNKSISDAQRARVIVFGIYNPSVGHAGHAFWRETLGQNLLSQLCDETGGEAYITTLSPPVSFDPFLQDIAQRLGNQYTLTFNARAENKAGLQPLRVTVQTKDADVAAPSSVFVKASK
jgi:hypothetical protein